MVYGTFRSLAERRVSPKNLGGPILIAQVAYYAAGSRFAELIYFLGMLSINLAVLNFLPIPPLDGGQMLFLIAEKIRGRPLPDSALIAGTYFGLLLVLSLMVFRHLSRCLPSIHGLIWPKHLDVFGSIGERRCFLRPAKPSLQIVPWEFCEIDCCWAMAQARLRSTVRPSSAVVVPPSCRTSCPSSWSCSRAVSTPPT